MADNSPLVWPGAIPTEDAAPSWEDYGRAALSGVGGLASAGLSGLSYVYGKAGRNDEAQYFADEAESVREGTNDVLSGMTPEGKARLQSDVTGGKFWQHAVSSIALKGAQMAPAIVAAALPGGVIADVLGATAGVATSIGVGAGLSASQFIDTVASKVDGVSDADLQKESALYAGLRTRLPEDQARQEFKTHLTEGDGALALNAIAGAVAGGVGIGGMVARGAAGGAAKETSSGILSRAGKGALEAGIPNAAQAGVANATEQNAGIKAGSQKEFDGRQWTSQVLEALGLGALPGAAHGAFRGGSAPKKTNVAIPEPEDINTGGGGGAGFSVGDERAPDPAQQAALSANSTIPKNPTPQPPGTPVEQGVSEPAIPIAPTPPEAATAPVSAAVTPVTEEGNPVSDVGKTVPESPATLDAQSQEVQAGKRPVVLYPKGTPVPDLPEGLKKTVTKEGVFHYDPTQVKYKEIMAASKAGKLNELLGLGPVTKEEAVARTQAGETPVGVTERTPEGIETKAAAGTTETAPEQVASLEAQKQPGNTVQVEAPEQVLAGRLSGSPKGQPKNPADVLSPIEQANTRAESRAATEVLSPTEAKGARPGIGPKGARILRDVTPEGKAAADAAAKAINEQIKANIAESAPAEKEVVGKNRTQAEKEARAASNSAADEIIAAHPPGEGEVNYSDGRATDAGKARTAIKARAKAMIDAAKERGVEIPKVISDNTDSEMNHNTSMILLSEAQALLNKKAPARADYERFKQREPHLRAGNRELITADRRTEGKAPQAAKPKTEIPAENIEAPRGGSAEALSDKNTPEAALEAKQEAAPASGAEVDHDFAERLASARERDVTDRLSPEAKAKLEKVKALAEKGATEGERNAAQEAIARVKEKATASRVTAGVDRAGTFKVEAKRRSIGPKAKTVLAKTRSKSLGEGPVKAGEWKDIGEGFSIRETVDPSGNKIQEIREPQGGVRSRGIDSNGKEYAELEGFGDPFDRNNPGSPGAVDRRIEQFMQRRKGSANLPDQLAHRAEPEPTNARTIEEELNKIAGAETITGKGGEAIPIQTNTLAQVLPKLNLHKTGVSGLLLPAIARRLRTEIGHIKIHFVDAEQMARLSGVEGERAPLGYYRPSSDHIVVRYDQSDADMAHTVVHEAIHAAVTHAIAMDEFHSKRVQRLMNIALAAGLDKKAYAFTNVHEFMAEALSNHRFQEALASIKLTDEMAKSFHIQWFREKSVWSGVVALVRHMLRLPPGSHTALEAAMAVAEPAMRVNASYKEVAARVMREESLNSPHAMRAREDDAHFIRDPVAATKAIFEDPVTHAGDAIRRAFPTNKQFQRSAFKLLTNDNLRQIKEHLFGARDEENPLRRLTDTVEKMGARMREYRESGDRLARDLYSASRKFQGDRGWQQFTTLARAATIYDLHPDEALDSSANRHLSLAKDVQAKLAKGQPVEHEAAMRVWQSRSEHARLAKEYNALPPELKTLFKRAKDYYSKTQDSITRSNVDNILDTLVEAGSLPEKVREGLTERIMHGTMTEEDDAHFEGNKPLAKAVKSSEELRVRKGAYFPLMRRGDFVIRAEHSVAKPANATRIDPDTFEFKTRQEAHEFATSVGLPSKTDTAYYDPANGQRVKSKDEATSIHGTAEQRYQVKVQRQHTEFFAQQRDAEAARNSLLTDRNYENVKDLTRRSQNQNLDYELSSPQVQRLVDAIDKREGMSDQAKGIMKRALIESSLAMKAGTRVEQRRLPRRNVAGASLDFVRNLTDYNSSASRYLSRQDFRGEVDGSMQEMRDISRQHEYSGSEDTLDRDQVIQEMEKRLYGFGSPEYSGAMAPAWSYLMTMSFIQRMASPAHLMIHMTNPAMISGPVIGARHGFMAAFKGLAQAYRDMGGVTSALSEGIHGAARTFKDSTAEPTDFIEGFKSRLKNTKDAAGIRRMLDDLVETGHIHPDVGFEASRLDDAKSAFARGLSKVDTAFRELTGATESINRVAVAITAYRLEMAKQLKEAGASDHERAVRYVKDTLANTEGLYSSTNAAPIFRNPALRPFLQFKQFPQMIYHLLGRNLYQAFKGETPEIRKEAARAFAGVVATHAAMAGALGLPLEVIKAPVMLANALGVANTSWTDLEEKFQEKMAGTFGPQIGEVVSHGLSRALPFGLSPDVHHRLGLNSMLSFGEPSSNRAQDTMHYIEDFIGGAPASLAMDAMGGAQALRDGDFQKAAEKLLPGKALADIVRAYRGATTGKTNSKGLGMGALNPGEVLVQGLGFKPARQAQYDEASWAAKKEIRSQNNSHKQLMNDYAGATSAGAKARAMQAISAWNAKNPDERITHAMLQTAKDRAEEQKAPGGSMLGVPVTDHNRSVLERYSNTFNVR